MGTFGGMNAGGSVAVEDEGVSVVAAAALLNFLGAGVTATDAGGGQVDVTIPGGGGDQAFVWDPVGEDYVEGGRIFIGPEDPDVQYTPQAGDAWIDLEAIVAGSGGTFVRRVRQTLTNKTSFSGTGNEQWGTEEATLDDALLPALTNVTVFAELKGHIRNFNTNQFLYVFVEISLDGGSTWSTGLSEEHLELSGSVYNAQAVNPGHQVTGSVTGDIQARAMAQCNGGGSSPYDLTNGALYMEVLV